MKTNLNPSDITYTVYGFFLHGELLHTQVRWEASKGTYELISSVLQQPTLGEWVTTDIKGILHRYLSPRDFSHSGINDPLPTYGEAVPVAVHTWRNGNSMYKSYTPLEIPTQLPSIDMISSTLNLVKGRERKLYTYHGAEPLSVGKKYYLAEYGDFTVYDCIAKLAGDQYLLLVLNDNELVTRLTGPAPSWHIGGT